MGTNDDYLWDGSGRPDPEVRRLEQLLERFRHSRLAPDFPAVAPAEARPSRSQMLWPLAAAAALILALGATLLHVATRRAAGWTIADLSGSPRIGSNPALVSKQWKVGEALETDANSRVELQVAGLGQVGVEPNSRLTLLKASASQEHILLERGTIRASIVAPPYVFVVRTPTAYAMDMGCAYTLHVNDDGSSLLRVTVGWVDLQRGWRQSLVPAGAAAESRPSVGPGAPYFEDASERLRSALETVNFDLEDSQARSAALTTVLAEAQGHDSYTLLNLFRRVDPADRGRLYDRLAALVPAPAGATREGAIAGDWRTLDPWWDAVGVGHAKKGGAKIPHLEE